MLRIKLYALLLSLLLSTNVVFAGASDDEPTLPNLPEQPGGANIDMATLRRQVDDANKRAEEMAPHLKLPRPGDATQSKSAGPAKQEVESKKPSQLSQGEQAATEGVQRYQSEMKPRVEEEIFRQEKTCSTCSTGDQTPGNEAENASPAANYTKVVHGLREKFFEPDEKLYLFISSSMPDSTVRAYLDRVAVAGKDEQVSTVMFGMIDGLENGKKAMSEYLARVLLVNPGCKDSVEAICQRYPINLELNSMVFKKFNITKVPSVVYVRGDKYWTVDGDSSLEFLLKKINSELKESSIDNLIQSIIERY